MKLISNLSIGSLRLILSAAGSSLLNGLVSYWPLNEVSGVRYDAVGSNDLTDNNTVGAVLRGPEGTVANLLAANSEYLSSADPSLDLTGDFTYAIWYKQQPPDAALNMLMGNDPAGSRGIMCGIDGGDQLLDYWYITEGANYNHITYPIGEGVYSHVWRLAWFWREGSTMYCTKNTDDAGKASGAIVGSVPYTGEFWIGRTQAGYGNIQTGPVGVWSRALTAQERADVFAQGNSLRYSDLPAGLLAGLVSYWHLDEVSGVRYDSHGSNDLTDNNTVYASNGGPNGTVASLVQANSETLSHPTLANDLDWSQGVTLLLWHKGINEVGKGFASFGTNIYSGQECFGLNDQGSSNDVLFIQMELGDYAPKLNAVQGVDSPHQSGFFDWHMLGARYKADTKTGLVSLDANTPAETTALANHLVFAQANKAFRLGSDGNAFITGRQSCAGVWNRTLSNAEVTAVFNGGVPKRYVDLSDAEKVGLVSFWNLDEQSGVRYDSHGSNHLTDNNTVGSVINAGAAMDGAAASFVAANSEELTDDFAWDGASDLSVAAWAYSDPATTATPLISLYGTNFNSMSLNHDTWSNGRVYGSRYVHPNGSDASILGIGGLGWRLFIFGWDNAQGKMFVSVNGGEPAYGGVVAPGAALTAITIGSNRAVVQSFGTATIDEVAIWDRVLTADERTELFAAGRGKYYDFS